jgi:hypothetical protein
VWCELNAVNSVTAPPPRPPCWLGNSTMKSCCWKR